MWSTPKAQLREMNGTQTQTRVTVQIMAARSYRISLVSVRQKCCLMTVSFRHGSGETLFVLVLCSTASRTVIAQCSSKVPMQLDSKVGFPHCFFFSRDVPRSEVHWLYGRRDFAICLAHTLRKMNGDHHYIVAELVLLDVSAFLLTSRS